MAPPAAAAAATAVVVLLAILIVGLWSMGARGRSGPFANAGRGGDVRLLEVLGSPQERALICAAALESPPLDPTYAHWVPAMERRVAERREGRVPTYDEVLLDDRQSNVPQQVTWEDKIEMYRRCDAAGAPRPRVYYAGVPAGPEELVAVMRGRARFVAKPTHLSGCQCVIVYDRGRDLMSGKVYDSLDRLARALIACLDWRARSFENDALKWVSPRLLIEEFICADFDVKVSVLWGRAFLAKAMHAHSRRGGTTGSFSREGVWGPCGEGDQPCPPPPHYGRLVEHAERLGRGTDFLRVDFLVGNDRYAVGELTVPPQQSRQGEKAEALLVERLLDGHEARLRAGKRAPGAKAPPRGGSGGLPPLVLRHSGGSPSPRPAAASSWGDPPPRGERLRPYFREAALRARLAPPFAHFGARYAARARLRARGEPWGGYEAVAGDRASANHPGQVIYEDKLQYYQLLDRRGVPHPQLYGAYAPPVDPKKVLAALEGRDRFVLKPTHLSSGDAVVLWEAGLDLYLDRPQRLTEAVARALKGLEARPDSDTTEALSWVAPRLMLEELLPMVYEIKWMTFWGRPFVGRVERGRGKTRRRAPEGKKQHPLVQGKLYADGAYVPVPGVGGAGVPGEILPFLPAILAAVVAAAAGTDSLRVDVMVGTQRWAVVECAVFTSPPFFGDRPLEELMGHILLDGHEARAARDGGPPRASPGS